MVQALNLTSEVTHLNIFSLGSLNTSTVACILFLPRIFSENWRLNRHWQWTIKILVFGQGWDRLARQWFSTQYSCCSLCHFCCYKRDELDSSVWYLQKPYMLVLQTGLGGALQHLTLDVFKPKQVPWLLYSAAWSGRETQVQVSSLNQQIFSLPSPQQWIWIHLIHGSGSWTRASWM